MKMIYFKLLFVHTETELLNVVKELLKNVKNATLLWIIEWVISVIRLQVNAETIVAHAAGSVPFLRLPSALIDVSSWWPDTTHLLVFIYEQNIYLIIKTTMNGVI